MSYTFGDPHPTDVYLFCDWGDNTVNPDGTDLYDLNNNYGVTDGMQQYDLTHAYAAAGVYDVKCNMSNLVSFMSLEKSVTIYERVEDLVVNLHYFHEESEDGHVDTAEHPKGPGIVSPYHSSANTNIR